MQTPIFYTAIRAVFFSFCIIIGLALGIFAVNFVISWYSTTSEYNQEILPNAKGMREKFSRDVPVILQINIDDTIGTDSLNAKTIHQQLLESREGDFRNNRVKAILLYIDSPGGTVKDTSGIYRELKEYKNNFKTPIYAYVDGLCASGGLKVALVADKIFSSEESLVGSVGVKAPTFMNISKFLEKIGVDTLTLAEGQGKDALNPFRVWKTGEEDTYRNIVGYYYERFVEHVITHRPRITREKLVGEYGAQIFPAYKAVEHGFIDESGVTKVDVLNELLSKVGIKDEQYQFIRFENDKSWKNLIKSQLNMQTGKLKHQITFSNEIDLLLGNQFLYLY